MSIGDDSNSLVSLLCAVLHLRRSVMRTAEVDPHGSKGYLKMVVEVPDSSWLTSSKNFKKDATLKLFKNGMSMSVQKSQVHKMAKLQDGEEIMLG
ncbi:hypothetical protein Tco_1226187 [Tanacetum coccineum]|uniref:Ubiquitin-like domain-containing protein n=1 Tax=Tanacetum coccineum TaxID=301880 RepID=A0ABQ4ZDJ1_9ASTR